MRPLIHAVLLLCTAQLVSCQSGDGTGTSMSEWGIIVAGSVVPAVVIILSIWGCVYACSATTVGSLPRSARPGKVVHTSHGEKFIPDESVRTRSENEVIKRIKKEDAANTGSVYQHIQQQQPHVQTATQPVNPSSHYINVPSGVAKKNNGSRAPINDSYVTQLSSQRQPSPAYAYGTHQPGSVGSIFRN